MLEKYKDLQPLAYKILKKASINNEHSHAYIIESNGYNDSMGLAKEFAKALFCVNNDQDKLNICTLIDENNFPELKIIDPDGMVIKKEEIDELQVEFSKKPIYSDKKVYIINNADRLNKSSGNSLLKFLEEPEQDIIAILITNNLYKMLETIVSRCQIIPLKENIHDLSKLNLFDRILKSINKTEEEIKNIFGESNYKENITKCIDFINYYEKYKLNTFVYVNDIWFEYYNEKEQFEIAFKIMALYYVDILKKACHTKIEIFSDYENNIDLIVKKLTVSNICNKIKTIIKLEQKIKENNNLNLIMDKLLIDLGRSDEIV